MQKNLKLLQSAVVPTEEKKIDPRKLKGPKIRPKVGEPRMKRMKDLLEQRKPDPTSYNQDDRILHEKLRDQNFGKMTDMRPSTKPVKGDYRQMLLPSVALTKPSLPQTAIAPEHIITDAEIDKMFEAIKRPGPGAHDVTHKLTEKRADIGVSKDLYKHDRKPEKVEEDDRAPLHPKTTQTLPNHMTFRFPIA